MFNLFVLFLKEADLVSGELVAIDGTKVRVINLLGMEKLLAKLRTWRPDYRKAAVLVQIRLVLDRYADLKFHSLTKAA